MTRDGHEALNFRAAMLVAPTADEEVDALPTVSMVALPDELLQHIVRQACNPLEPLVAVYLSSASHGLWALTPALLQQLRADYEVAIRLCRKLGLRSCKVLREAKEFDCCGRGLTADLALLGTLGLVLPALETLILFDPAAGPDGVQRLAERLGAGALPLRQPLHAIGVGCWPVEVQRLERWQQRAQRTEQR